MTRSILPPVRDRLIQLTETLHHLKDRIREAVATEMGRVVSEAVRDVLTTALTVRREEPPRPRADPQSWTEDWSEDDPDAGEDDRADAELSSSAPASPWATALSVGVVAAKWLGTQRVSVWPCLGGGVLATTAMLSGGPVLRATLVAVATAWDLVALTQSQPL